MGCQGGGERDSPQTAMGVRERVSVTRSNNIFKDWGWARAGARWAGGRWYRLRTWIQS